MLNLFVGEYAIWAGGLKHEKIGIAPGDVSRSVKDFIQSTGAAPARVAINPKYGGKFDKEVDNIPLEVRPGCLGWEVWLYPSERNTLTRSSALPVADTRLATALPPEHEGFPRIMLPLTGIEENKSGNKRGRKPRQWPVELIKQMAADGMGCKVIAEKLVGDGITISHMTVARLLRA